MIYRTMSRPEADKIVTWVEEHLTVTMAPWQKEMFATMVMYPDVKFELPKGRHGC